MSGRHKGRVALVTGGTAGIGLAIAERLAQEGAQVVICSRQEKNVRAAESELKSKGYKVTGLVCHVGTAEARKKLIDETVKLFGHVDVLVSNVAVNPSMAPFVDTDEKTWDKIFDVNVKSHFFLIKEAVPHMPKGSSILIVSSIAAYNGNPMLGAYSVSKTALVGMTKMLGKDLARKGIRVNGIAPGIIKTKFSQALWETEGLSDKTKDEIPLKRFGTSEECAGAASFFVSEKDSSYITGETLVISGGTPSRL